MRWLTRQFPFTSSLGLLSCLVIVAALVGHVDLIRIPEGLLGRIVQAVERPAFVRNRLDENEVGELLILLVFCGAAFIVDRTVTKTRANREALWTTMERLRALEQAAPVGIVALDLQGRVMIWNRAAEELFGWRLSEVVGHPSPLIPEDRQTEDAALIARVLEGEVVSGFETCSLAKDGPEISVSLCCSSIRDPEGHVSGTIRVLMDISQRKSLERQFLQAQKMEAFGQLAGGVAHDFNNLLTVIVGFSELALAQVRNQSDLTADIEEIKKAGERASQLTRQLLAFSRKQVWVAQILNLNHVIGQFERMLTRIVRDNVRLEILPTLSLGHTKADPGQIEQLLMNLVVNAQDAMPHGGQLKIVTANMTLGAEFTTQHSGAVAGRYVSLIVQDTGSGMTPHVLAHLFEPFFTTKGPGKGTGLGLSTVLALVEQSGGYVTVDSTLGVGTIVTTYWPRVDEAIESVAARSSVPTIEGTETILLVEDETAVRLFIGKALERYGYRILSARDAEEAMTVEERYTGTIDLLVTDMIMPGLGGPELVQQIVRRRPAIRVLFMSGYASREAVDHDVSAHLAQFIQKPFTPETLARSVRERLDCHVGRTP